RRGARRAHAGQRRARRGGPRHRSAPRILVAGGAARDPRSRDRRPRDARRGLNRRPNDDRPTTSYTGPFSSRAGARTIALEVACEHYICWLLSECFREVAWSYTTTPAVVAGAAAAAVVADRWDRRPIASSRARAPSSRRVCRPTPPSPRTSAAATARSGPATRK